jgi:CelD/BcsL family acetyltransferase involved in cellulose biosynthesis
VRPVTDLRLIRDSVALAALAPEWRSLWERCPDATPFQSPEWLLPWQHHLGQGALQVLTIRRAGSLEALMPLHRHGWPPRLSLLGQGISDYLDLLLVPSASPETTAALHEWLRNAVGRGASIDFDQHRPGSPLLAGSLPGCLRQEWLREPCPILALPSTVEELRSRWSSSLRKHAGYARRRFEREGGSIEMATAETLDEILTALFQAHQRRWNRRWLPGAFASTAVRQFHREAAAGFLSQGMLRLYALRQGGRCVAALYCFASHGRCHYYAAGFYAEAAAHSPGTQLIAHALEDAVARGDMEFDFLRGNEPYKYRWGATDRFNRRLLIYPPTVAGKWTARRIETELAVEAAAKRLAARWVSGGS